MSIAMTIRSNVGRNSLRKTGMRTLCHRQSDSLVANPITDPRTVAAPQLRTYNFGKFWTLCDSELILAVLRASSGQMNDKERGQMRDVFRETHKILGGLQHQYRFPARLIQNCISHQWNVFDQRWHVINGGSLIGAYNYHGMKPWTQFWSHKTG